MTVVTSRHLETAIFHARNYVNENAALALECLHDAVTGKIKPRE